MSDDRSTEAASAEASAAASDWAGGQSLPPVRAARWQTVYLVCKACADRSHGPKHLKPKRLAQEVKARTKHASVRARVVMTGCLGLCPKNAAALAVSGATGVRLVTVRSKDDVPAALAALAAGAPPRTDEGQAVTSA